MNSTSHSSDGDQQRRQYWTDQLEQGYSLVQKIEAFPVIECGEPFASLEEAAEQHGVEMLFSNTKIAGDLDRVFSIRRSLVNDVIAIARTMNQRGWILKIEDGFRSLEMQRHLGSRPEIFDAVLQKCIWEFGGSLPSSDVIFRRGCVLVANVPKAGTHMSGTAIDVSVFNRDDGHEIWRGNRYLDMSERTSMRSPFVEPEALANRLAITEIMESHGFMHYPFEFWHYNKGDALAQILNGRTDPAKFGPVHWDPATNSVTPVDQPLQPLRPLDEIQRELEAAVARLHTWHQ
ncbi:MAG: M15 family metallopeptidase [Planctomycetota bacterium]